MKQLAHLTDIHVILYVNAFNATLLKLKVSLSEKSLSGNRNLKLKEFNSHAVLFYFFYAWLSPAHQGPAAIDGNGDLALTGYHLGTIELYV